MSKYYILDGDEDRPRGMSMDSLLAREIIKRDKLRIKEEKRKKKKPPKHTFTLLETWGIVLVGSIPITFGQLYLLHQVQLYLNGIFQVAPH